MFKHFFEKQKLAEIILLYWYSLVKEASIIYYFNIN